MGLLTREGKRMTIVVQFVHNEPAGVEFDLEMVST